MSMSWTFSLVTTAIVGALFAWVASRFFVEARRTGELELLLTTPVGAREIVSAQWEDLMRQIRFPLAVMLVPFGLQMLMMLFTINNFPSGFRGLYPVTMVLSGVNTLVGTLAVCRVALWFGLRIIGQARVVLWTVLLTKIVPYAFAMIWRFLFQSLFLPITPGNWSAMSWFLTLLAPQLATLLFFLWLIRFSRRQLLHPMVKAEPLDPSEILSRALLRVTKAVSHARQWRQI